MRPFRLVLLAGFVLVASAVGACSSPTATTSTHADSASGDAAADALADAAVDTAADTAADTAVDSSVDTSASADTASDAALDTAVDTALDVAPDAAADAAPDAVADVASPDADSSSTVGKPCQIVKAGECGPGEYCQLAQDGCNYKNLGVCSPKPGTCTGESNPVCGCDGKPYPNPCLAAAAGFNVANSGECPATGKMCGGIAGFVCPAGMVCDRKECYPDAAGQCAWQPASCPPVEPGQEECGCNGKTYLSACHRLLDDMGLKAPGVCAP